mmetsp:Transcript_15215/g.37353  ORF Transcript_15215/g.37353 Transcript_15215/m.37353 type:complete len:226 (-) Transcript_15215:1136-1813(-)
MSLVLVTHPTNVFSRWMKCMIYSRKNALLLLETPPIDGLPIRSRFYCPSDKMLGRLGIFLLVTRRNTHPSSVRILWMVSWKQRYAPLVRSTTFGTQLMTRYCNISIGIIRTIPSSLQPMVRRTIFSFIHPNRHGRIFEKLSIIFTEKFQKMYCWFGKRLCGLGMANGMIWRITKPPLPRGIFSWFSMPIKSRKRRFLRSILPVELCWTFLGKFVLIRGKRGNLRI